MITIRSALLAAVALAPLGAAPALAQTEAQTTASRIETVTVTARRVEESAQSTPVAVTAFSEERLAELGSVNVGALQGAVPNLNIVQGRGSGSSANIFIRGVGQPDALATFDPAVGVYVDDVYYSRIRGALLDIFDVERIEVLRGPQGTLYGKNTIGGALKIVSAQPSNDLRASAKVTVGDYDQLEFNARLSGPIVEDTLFGGLSLYRASRDGYVVDPAAPGREYNDKDTTGGRAVLRLAPADSRLALTFSVDYTEEKPAMTVGRRENLLFQTNLGVAATAPTRIIPLATRPVGDFDFRTATTTTTPNRQDLEHWGASVVATYDFNDAWSLKSITAGRALVYDDFIDIDATPFELGDVFVGVEQAQFSQEFQLTYDAGGKFAGVFGVYALQEDISSNQVAFGDDIFVLQPLPTVRIPVTFERFIIDNLNLHSYAAYAQGDWRFSDRLKATFGLRVTDERKSYVRSTFTRSNQVFLDSRTTPALNFAFGRRVGFDDVSPMIGLDYQWTDNVFVYGKIAKGFKSGGINGRANSPGQDKPYEPEEVISYEAGVKTDLLDGMLRLNATAFYNDYKNFQARISQPDPIVIAALTVLNAGKMETSGFEIEATAVPVPGLRLDASIGYLNAEYKEFRDLRALGGSRAFQTPAFAPEWTARFAGSYDFELGDFGALQIGADASYRSEMALAVDNSTINVNGVVNGAIAPAANTRFPGMWQDDVWLTNARLVWTAPAGNWSLGVFGKNLSDEVYKTDAQEFSDVAGIQTAYYGAPRTWQIVLSVKN